MKHKYPRLALIYHNMLNRCNNPKNAAYKNYGGKGITVCDEWANSFEAFELWAIKAGYNDKLTIDRLDNSKGYCPDNCQWVTKSVNCARTQRYGKDQMPDYEVKNEAKRSEHKYGQPLTRLIEWEKENGYKAKFVAEKLNVSPSQYSQIKLGKIRPSVEFAALLQSKFGVDPFTLLK